MLEAEKRLEEAHGKFAFFGLFLRADSPGKWDVVAAADWIQQDPVAGLRQVAEEVQRTLSPEHLLAISRVVVLPPDDPRLLAVSTAVRTEHTPAEVEAGSFDGMKLEQAVVLTSRPPGNGQGEGR
ncbi:MAG TPA: hypothetical protein VIL46_17410 [Gemmataceae bacterium]